MKSVLILTAGKPESDPRPNRMVRCLAGEHRITLVAGAPLNLPNVEFIPLPARPRVKFRRKLLDVLRQKYGRLLSLIWRPTLLALAKNLRARRFDLIITHDLHLLPVALAIAGRHSRVIFDAREYYPRQGEDRWWWRTVYQPVAERLCAKYLRRAHQITTVSAGLAQGYRENYGVHCVLLPSLPRAIALEPGPVQPDRIRMIHHGQAAPARRIELMIDLMRLLPPRFSLDLMLAGMDSAYGRTLRERARGLDQVRFRPPVPFGDIITESNAYDIGLYLLPPTGFNTRHALPNKFFEFIQARLLVAIGPSPDMAAWVRAYDLGVVADDFTPAAMARSLTPLTGAEVRRHKEQAHQAARVLHSGLTDEISLAMARGTPPPSVFPAFANP